MREDQVSRCLLSSICSSVSIIDQSSFYYGATIIVIFLVINSLTHDFEKDEKLKAYLICLCSILFGFGGLALTLIAFLASLVSYIILYNSTDFYKFFFSDTDASNQEELEILDQNEDTK